MRFRSFFSAGPRLVAALATLGLLAGTAGSSVAVADGVSSPASIAQRPTCLGGPCPDTNYPENEISFSEPPARDNFRFTGWFNGVYFPKPFTVPVEIVIDGVWAKGSSADNRDSSPKSLSCSYSIGVSKSTAHEFSVGMSVSAEKSVKPFGVGMDLTVEMSVGYALTLTNTNTTEWTATGNDPSVDPMKRLQCWAPMIRTTARHEHMDLADYQRVMEEAGYGGASGIMAMNAWFAGGWTRTYTMPANTPNVSVTTQFIDPTKNQ